MHSKDSRETPPPASHGVPAYDALQLVPVAVALTPKLVPETPLAIYEIVPDGAGVQYGHVDGVITHLGIPGKLADGTPSTLWVGVPFVMALESVCKAIMEKHS